MRLIPLLADEMPLGNISWGKNEAIARGSHLRNGQMERTVGSTSLGHLTEGFDRVKEARLI